MSECLNSVNTLTERENSYFQGYMHFISSCYVEISVKSRESAGKEQNHASEPERQVISVCTHRSGDWWSS